ncbi:MAG: hypothetical protein F4Z75_03580 [Synechococcus sp. SB0668_bin_15]|nr:hypothetical protein [Synechococcus sp. SB0668_bin_15]MXZ82825.1 hypothetical protein [Synechococcus sp. SB0666_bin_14]MYC49294.1 hypothetical protein [Synechococcus sp. SB0662_bin_14]MYG46981.1 hypothetical protein [Synechococcus sp. SB0675_bin_6]
MQGVEPVQPVPSQVNKQQQERDWLMIGIMLTILGITIDGFLVLGSGLSVRIDDLGTSLSTRIDGLYELLLSLKR